MFIFVSSSISKKIGSGKKSPFFRWKLFITLIKSFDDMIMIEKELEAKRQEADSLKSQSLKEVKNFIEFVESML